MGTGGTRPCPYRRSLTTGIAGHIQCPLMIVVYGISFLPDRDYADRLTHGSRVKVHVVSELGGLDRIPAYIQRVIQESDADFTGQYWVSPSPYQWQHHAPRFECLAPKACGSTRHTSVWHRKRKKVGTFNEFTQNVLPRIEDSGYNAVQLMAVMEHPYYARLRVPCKQFLRRFKPFRDPRRTQSPD